MPKAPWPSPSVAAITVLLSALACRPEPPDPPPDPVVSTEPTGPARPSVDSAQMMASIEWLASDERRGRYTLQSEDIEAAASWIGERYAELGLEPAPGATAFRVPYELRTGARAGEQQRLAVTTKRGKLAEFVEVDAEDFSPRVEGNSSEAKGELVFVGYAARWDKADQPQDPSAEDEGAQPPELPIDSYDDLAGVELDGKIALVLANAPNTPDLFELFGAMQSLVENFEVEAAPLREQNELKKLEKLHREVRETMLDYASSFVDTKALAKDSPFWTVEDPKAALDPMRMLGPVMSLASARPQFDPQEHTLSRKVGKLAEAGAVGVIVVQGPRSFVGSEARKADALPPVDGSGGGGMFGTKLRILPNPTPIPVVQLRWKRADILVRIGGEKLSQVQAAIDADFQPRSQALGVEVELRTDIVSEAIEVPNVLASIPGKSDEVIMLGAHFDHIGDDVDGQCRAIIRREDRDSICNGADDNASGTAMLLELARVYQQAGITPERTLVFAHFSGEELGLLGSRALADTPPFDQARVSAMINLDMVGRLGPRGLAIGGLYSSEDWMPLLDELGDYDMDILYEGATTTRSDHAHWFERQIPVLFFFTGMHGDYHRAGDELEDINVEGMGSIGQMVSDLVYELAMGRAIGWSDPPEGGGIGRGLPGSNPETIIKKNF